MANYPLDEMPRQEIRDELIDYYNTQGYKKARNHGLSLRCQSGDHRCRNTGTGCLCRCHDQVGLKEW